MRTLQPKRAIAVASTALLLCGSVVAGVVLSSGGGHPAAAPQNRVVLGADVDNVDSLAALADAASVILIGEATGSPTFVARSPDGDLGDYTQDVEIETVCSGDVLPAAVVPVVRFGASPTSTATFETDELGGPLPAGRTVYFLQPSAEPGVLQVVGHTQGTLGINELGVITSVGANGFERLLGVSVVRLGALINGETPSPSISPWACSGPRGLPTP